MPPKRRLTAPGPKPVTLAPVHPNRGLEAAYRKKLQAAVDELHASIVYWIKAQYRATPPEMLAMDKSPAAELRDAMARLSRRWLRKFSDMADQLAGWFSKASQERYDAALKHILKKGGWTVEMKMTREVNDVVQASIAENVTLIKSIAQQHLNEVSGLVMRATQAGRDMKFLTDELEKFLPKARNRAALIARDQTNKATAAVTRARQTELGITHAIWLHSSGGRFPRASHVQMSGKPYSIADGVVLDGEKVWPGTAINCRCVSKSIVPGFRAEKVLP